MSDVDTAIVAKLAGDAQLAALMPDGVWYEVPPKGSSRYVIVSRALASDVSAFGQRAYEQTQYLIKAVAPATTGVGNVREAATRIDELMTEPLTVPGYVVMLVRRNRPIRRTDPDDADLRWVHRGGYYDVMVHEQ